MSSPDMNDLEWPSGQARSRGFISGPEGALEADVDLPEDPARGFVVVCHPHPQQGGTKDNKVVYMTARAAREAGLASIRFNFRATGHSEGRYDGGRGEQDDLRAVRAWAGSASGLADAGLAGFSFGSAVALHVAADDGAASLVTIGLPANYFGGTMPRPDCPWLAVVSGADEIIDPDASIAAVNSLDPPAEVQVVAGASHFLHGHLTELRRHVQAFWAERTA